MEKPPPDMVALNKPQYVKFYNDVVGESSILCRIIELDDDEALKEYLVLYPYQLRGPKALFEIATCSAPDAFEYAAKCGATKVLHYLLDYERQHPEKRLRFGHGIGGYGLLNVACRHGHLDMVKFLLMVSKDPAADIAFRDGDGWTPLLAAAAALSRPDQSRAVESATKYTERCEELMTLLLDKGATADDGRVRRFRHAGGQYYEADCRKRWTENYFSQEPDEFDNFVEGTGDMWDMPSPDGETTFLVDTVLSLAVPRAEPAIIKRLIDQGADIYAQTGSPCDGEFEGLAVIPLHIAARCLNTPAIEQLFKDRNRQELHKILSHRDSNGRTPLHLAAIGFHTSMLPKNQINEHLIAILGLFLPYCTKEIINARDRFARTALHYTMLAGYSSIPGVLTEYCMGFSNPARYTSRYSMARIMVESGADPCIKTADGKSMLHIWAHHGLACSYPVEATMLENERQLVHLFTRLGVAVADTDDLGNAALHYAALGLPRPAAVQLLLQLGAAPDVTNNAGDTPLHVAANMTMAFRDNAIGFDAALKLQDETMQIILAAAENSGKAMNMMGRQNASGITPLRIKDETRRKMKEQMAPPTPRERVWRGGRLWRGGRTG